MNAEEREARKRAAATLRNELRTRAERGWEKFSASEALDVMVGRETGSEVERKAWRLVGEMREHAKRCGVTAKWLTDRLAERAGHWERSASAPSGGELTAVERNAQQRIAKREPLKLDPEIDAALADIVERIRSVVPAADLTLGGGTVLAARYNHRRSFDVDLWYPVLRAEKIYIGHGADVWTKHLGTMLSSDGTGANLFECNGIARGVEFSISASDAHNTAGTQPIAGHEVQAQMTQQILEGKILGRLCDAEAPVAIRDLYDIAIACRLEPESVRTVLQKARRDAKRQSYITGRLKRTPDDLHRADPKPVTEPRYRIEMHGLARRLIGLLESGDPLGGGPKATPLEFGAGATIAPQR